MPIIESVKEPIERMMPSYIVKLKGNIAKNNG
jgi:hypothetical protein